jgi:hypothetical protein
MHQPYSDAPTKKGILISPAEEIEPLVQKVRRFPPFDLFPSPDLPCLLNFPVGRKGELCFLALFLTRGQTDCSSNRASKSIRTASATAPTPSY